MLLLLVPVPCSCTSASFLLSTWLRTHPSLMLLMRVPVPCSCAYACVCAWALCLWPWDTQDGYKVLEPPASYVPIRTPARKLLATPTPMAGATPLYALPEEDRQQAFDVPKELPGLPNIKPEDMQYFGALLQVTAGLPVLQVVQLLVGSYLESSLVTSW